MASLTRATSGSIIHARSQGGFTYLMLLLWVVLAGVMLAALGTSWSLMSRREREAELLWRGEQYKRALASYARTGTKLQIAAAEAAAAATANALPPSATEAAAQGQPASQAVPGAQAASATPPIPGPVELKDLLEDRRSGKVQRHLRRLYPDHITGSPRWGLVRSSDGRIAGVYSLSDAEPVRRGLGVERYRELVFGNANAAAPAASDAASEGARAGSLPVANTGPNGSRK